MVFTTAGGGANQLDTGYEIDNSLRFNPSDSAYLTKTPSSTGNRRTWTFSCWFKLSNVGTDNFSLFTTKYVNGDNTDIVVSSNKIQVYSVGTSGYDFQYATSGLFRDVSAWYHIVVAVDTTQGTDSNRVKIYINGSQVTSFSTTNHPNQDFDTFQNLSGEPTYIGASDVNVLSPAITRFFDGYLSEIYMIDGTQYTASDFGEYNDNGVWIPKDASGDLTFGTNGFYMEFKQTGTGTDASGIGADTSGNDNHFAVTNLAATDVTTDTPTNNFCTINSVFADAGTNTIAADYSEGNTKLLKTVDGWGHGRGTFLLSSGKWYAEAKVTEEGAGQTGQFGIVPSVLTGTTDANDKIEGLRVEMAGSDTLFRKMDTGIGSNVFTDFASGDIVMLAIDLDNNKLWVGNDGTWYNNNNASTTLNPSNHDVTLPSNDVGWIFTIGGYRDGGNNLAWEFNWGNPSFSISSSNADENGYGNMEFAVPSGFYTCCTKNLAEYG
jgi:hypothetical protein